MPELLPCPFCGSQANAKFVRHGLIAGNGFQGICCTVCSATVKERSQLKSIERWNARAKLAVENGNSLQQLKAEISAQLEKLFATKEDYEWDEALSLFLSEMQKLSAV